MSATIRAVGLMVFLTLAGRGGAQEPAAAPPAQAPPPSAGAAGAGSAQSEAGEPRADTSAPAPEEVGRTEPTAAPSPMPAGPTTAAASRSRSASTTERPAQPISGSKGAKPGAADRLELGTATVTGDREEPKVMYVVPWKKSDIGDLSGKPMNSLLEEALAPVDRDEFRREVMYYTVVKADAAQNGASVPPAKGEK